MMPNVLAQLRQLISGIHPLSDDDWHAFASVWDKFSAKRKEQLTVPGEKEKYLYFVIDGVQRVYYFDDQKREATIVFTYNPSFGGVLDSFMMQQSSKYFYETLTPSEFLRAPAMEVHKLIEANSAIETMVRKGITVTLGGVMERLVELQCFTAEEKFKSLLKRSPHILQLVPHKYLANYIGMDATNFSKLINKIRI